MIRFCYSFTNSVYCKKICKYNNDIMVFIGFSGMFVPIGCRWPFYRQKNLFDAKSFMRIA